MIIRLIDSVKKSVENPFKGSEFDLINEFLIDVYSYPLLLPFREETLLKTVLNQNSYLNENNESLPMSSYVFQKIFENFDSFEKSYKFLVQECKNKNEILLNFFSNKKKLDLNFHMIKSNNEMSYIFLDSLKKIGILEIFEDLKNIGKMKFLLFFLKNISLEPFDAENYLKLIHRSEGLLFEMMLDFSNSYTLSQIEEFNIYEKNHLWRVNDYSGIDGVCQPYFNEVSHFSFFPDSSLKNLMKGYKIIKRVLSLPRRLDKFNEEKMVENDKKKEIEDYFQILFKKILGKYSEIDIKSLNLIEANEVIMYHILLNDFFNKMLKDKINNPSSIILFAKNKKFLKRISEFNYSLMKLLSIHKINRETLKNEKINYDLFIKATNLHLSLTYALTMFDYFFESITKRTIDDPTCFLLLDKIESRIPLY